MSPLNNIAAPAATPNRLIKRPNGVPVNNVSAAVNPLMPVAATPAAIAKPCSANAPACTNAPKAMAATNVPMAMVTISTFLVRMSMAPVSISLPFVASKKLRSVFCIAFCNCVVAWLTVLGILAI